MEIENLMGKQVVEKTNGSTPPRLSSRQLGELVLAHAQQNQCQMIKGNLMVMTPDGHIINVYSVLMDLMYDSSETEQ